MAPLKEDIKKAFKKGLLPSHLSFLTQTRLRLGRKIELHLHPQRESILCVWYRSLGSVGTFPGGASRVLDRAEKGCAQTRGRVQGWDTLKGAVCS